jgi:hypothetical protein
MHLIEKWFEVYINGNLDNEYRCVRFISENLEIKNRYKNHICCTNYSKLV